MSTQKELDPRELARDLSWRECMIEMNRCAKNDPNWLIHVSRILRRIKTVKSSLVLQRVKRAGAK